MLLVGHGGCRDGPKHGAGGHGGAIPLSNDPLAFLDEVDHLLLLLLQLLKKHVEVMTGRIQGTKATCSTQLVMA